MNLNQTKPRDVPTRRSGHSRSKLRLTDAYGVLVFSLAPLFYALIASVFFTLLEIIWDHAPQLFSGHWIQQWPLVIALLLIAGRLAAFLFLGLWGLVTPAKDPNLQPEHGMLAERETHPGLFAAIDEVRQRVSSPEPDQVWISSRPECYAAEFRWFAVSTRRRLILVLGLPHLALLSVSELKSLLAHELAHFGRGDTTSGVFLYRFVKHLQSYLTRHAKKWWHWIDPVYWLCLVYHWICHRLYAPLSRFHELRADNLSAAAYGGDLAVRTLLKEWQLGYQFDSAVASFDASLATASDGTRLDVFSWFANRCPRFSPDGYAYLEQRIVEEEQFSFWDSHPTVKRRLEAMRRHEPAAYLDSRPAHSLLSDFAVLGCALQDAVIEQPGQVRPPETTAPRKAAFHERDESSMRAASSTAESKSKD